MKDFKNIQIGDILESWCAGEVDSYCVIAKKTEKEQREIYNDKDELVTIEQEITTLKVVESNCHGSMTVGTINEDFADLYELTNHYDLSLE